jgi:hypothetical protein
MMFRFQTLLSISTCAATPGAAAQLEARGGAMQVDSINSRVESAYGISA